MKPYLRALSLNLMIAAFASPVFISSAHAANLPQSVSLQYAGHYNGLTLPATMTFTRNGKGYKVVSTIKVPLYHIRFESGGSISGRPSGRSSIVLKRVAQTAWRSGWSNSVRGTW